MILPNALSIARAFSSGLYTLLHPSLSSNPNRSTGLDFFFRRASLCFLAKDCPLESENASKFSSRAFLVILWDSRSLSGFIEETPASLIIRELSSCSYFSSISSNIAFSFALVSAFFSSVNSSSSVFSESNSILFTTGMFYVALKGSRFLHFLLSSYSSSIGVY